MKSRFDALLNGVALSGLDENICVTDISYPSPEISYTIAKFAGRNGGMATNRKLDQTVVSISFELHVYGTRHRQTACQQIVAWAKNGGRLQTSDRTDQYLQCICTKLPSIESASKWTDELTVEFTAYGIPYWQGVFPSKAVFSGADAEGEIFVQGNAETRPDIQITANAAVTSLTVGFGSTSVALSGLSVSSGGVIQISHDENGILSIKTGTTSLLGKLTVTSSDDLVADCGNIPVSVEANGSVTAEFTVKGVWH